MRYINLRFTFYVYVTFTLLYLPPHVVTRTSSVARPQCTECSHCTRFYGSIVDAGCVNSRHSAGHARTSTVSQGLQQSLFSHQRNHRWDSSCRLLIPWPAQYHLVVRATRLELLRLAILHRFAYLRTSYTAKIKAQHTLLIAIWNTGLVMVKWISKPGHL